MNTDIKKKGCPCSVFFVDFHGRFKENVRVKSSEDTLGYLYDYILRVSGQYLHFLASYMCSKNIPLTGEREQG